MKKSLLIIFITLSIFLSGCNLKPQKKEKDIVSPTPTSSLEISTVSPSPSPISPTPPPSSILSPVPTTKSQLLSPSNLLQAAIELSCFLSNNDPGTPGTEQIYQKYNVTPEQISDYHYKAYKKQLPPDEQAAFENGTKTCR